MQWLRYPEAQVFYFDKGASSRASTLLTGGQFYVLGGDQSELASFQPLAQIDAPDDRAWAQEWVQDHRRRRGRADHTAGKGRDLERIA